MIISIDIEQLKATIEEETSRVASRSYAEDGSSLYDAIVIKSRDKEFVERTLQESADVICSACSRFLDHSYGRVVDGAIVFKTQESYRRSKATLFENLIRSSLVNLIVSKYMSNAQQDDWAKKYDEMASLNLKMLIKEIYGKMPPKRMEEN